jgi:hypothetical protein
MDWSFIRNGWIVGIVLIIVLLFLQLPSHLTAVQTPTSAASQSVSTPTRSLTRAITSPDGQYQIIISQSTLQLESLKTGQMTPFDLGFGTIDPSTVRFSSDGSALIGVGAPLYYAFNLKTLDIVFNYAVVDGQAVFSPDGRTLAYFVCDAYGGRGQFCDQTQLNFIDTQTGQQVPADFGPEGWFRIGSMAFSEDSRSLRATGCLNYNNPYFGTCGDEGAMTWTRLTGERLHFEVVCQREAYEMSACDNVGVFRVEL